MDSESMHQYPYQSSKLLILILKWRWILILVFLISGILGVVFSSSYFITPLYKSTTILYPTDATSASRSLISNISSSKDLLKVGDEEQIEQMLQLLHSNLIRDRMIDKYDLISHYKIDPESEFLKTKLYREYERKFEFKRNEFMAIEITVWDKDAQMAADMANEIAVLIDSTKKIIQKERAVQGFKIVEKEYNQLKRELKLKEDSITFIRELGVQDYETQSERLNQQLAVELAKGNTAGIKRLEKKLDVLAKYGSAYVSIRSSISHDIEKLSDMRSKYIEAKIDATEILPQKFIINKAIKAEKKSYPIRWLIVVLLSISTTFLAFLILLFVEKFKSIKLTLSKN